MNMTGLIYIWMVIISACFSDINACLSYPCKNGTTCHDQNGDYICECTEDWTGVHCEQMLESGASHISRRSILQDSPYYCDPGWILDRSSCYYIDLNPLSRDSANSKCQDFDGYLVEVNDDAENSILVEKVKEHGSFVWIGLKYDLASSTWIWSYSGNKLTKCSFINWAPGEPNRKGAEYCVHYHNDHFAWNDMDCHYKLGYVCEKPAIGSSAEQTFTSHHISETDCTCQPGYTGDYCETDLCRPYGADVVFLLDVSLSLSQTIFETAKAYVKDFVTTFQIGPSDFQFALVTVSFQATIHFPLNKHVDNVTILKTIDGIKFDNGPTFTGRGLEKIRKYVFASSNGARENVKKFVIVLTDGLSSDLIDTKTQADYLKTEGVTIISIGAGRQLYQQELIDIASHCTRVFPLSNRDAINTVFKAIVDNECPDCYRTTSDVAIMIDNSKEGFSSRYYQQISAITYLVKEMPINDEGVHVSCAQYAENVNEVFKFTDYMTSSDIIITLNKLKSVSSAANVIGALEHLRRFSFLEFNGVRSQTRKVALLVTNGNFNRDNQQDILYEAKLLKESGILLATITIGVPESMDLLLEMASDTMFTYIIGDEIDIKADVLQSLLGSFEFNVCSGK